MLKSVTITALIIALSACGGRVIDDGLDAAPDQLEVASEDDGMGVIAWRDDSEPPPEDHVYREDNNGCLRGVVWAERLTDEQIQGGWCVDTLVVRVPRDGRFVMPTLEEVQGDLRIIGEGARQIRLPSVKRVQGDVIVEASGRYEYPDIANVLDLTGLRIVDKGIYISGGKVSSLNLQNLETVGTDVIVDGIRNLSSLRFPSLLFIASSLQINDTTIASVSAPILEQVGQVVSTNNPLLDECGLEEIADGAMSELEGAEGC